MDRRRITDVEENENRVGEPEEAYTQRTWQGEDYSMSELAPAKLFPSDDTIINIEEDVLDNKVSKWGFKFLVCKNNI